MSSVTHHEPCPNCRSEGRDKHGDNLAVYGDGHSYCFACGFRPHGLRPDIQSTPIEREVERTTLSLKRGEYQAIPERGLTKDACTLYKYQVSSGIHIANYLRDGHPVAQKLRAPGKKWQMVGSMGDKSILFGSHTLRGEGKMVVVTEGEIDAISAYQAMGTWPVVSIPTGSKGAAKAIKDNLELLLAYETIVLCFDMDEHGRSAVEACVDLFPPGRVKVTHLKYNDPNEYTKRGEIRELKQAIWDSRSHKPDGVLAASDVEITTGGGSDFDYPWPQMNEFIEGRRYGELIAHISGTGMGKSTVMRELIYHDITSSDDPVGVLMLEESPEKTMKGLISLHANKPLKDYDVEDRLDDEEFIKSKKLYIYDHWGSAEDNAIMTTLEYMVVACGCKRLYLDHITLLMAGRETGDERKALDVLITKLGLFTTRHNVHFNFVSQLKQGGKEYEEGAHISLGDIRGTSLIKQTSHQVISYTRNQQDENQALADTLQVNVLKDRFGGNVGVATNLRYSRDTGRLIETTKEIFNDPDTSFRVEVDYQEDHHQEGKGAPPEGGAHRPDQAGSALRSFVEDDPRDSEGTPPGEPENSEEQRRHSPSTAE